MCFRDFQVVPLNRRGMTRVLDRRGLNAFNQLVSVTLQAYSAILNELFEAAVIGGSIEFERYSMVEDLVDALAEVLRCFTVLEPAEEVGL